MRQLTDTEKLVSDNASVNVVTIGGRLYAMGETPYQHEVDPDTMEIKNKVGTVGGEGGVGETLGLPAAKDEGHDGGKVVCWLSVEEAVMGVVGGL